MAPYGARRMYSSLGTSDARPERAVAGHEELNWRAATAV